MKCGYSQCKFGGNVDKKDAVKVGNRYYHKECNDKKNIKTLCSDKLKQHGMMSKLINIFLKSIIDDSNCDIHYLLFVINHVVNNGLKLNNPYGIKYYMNNYKIEALYNEHLKAETSKTFKDMSSCETVAPTEFTPNKVIPKYLKIL